MGHIDCLTKYLEEKGNTSVVQICAFFPVENKRRCERFGLGKPDTRRMEGWTMTGKSYKEAINRKIHLAKIKSIGLCRLGYGLSV